VSVTQPVLRLQVTHDGHVLFEAAVRDDLLPFRDRAPVLLLDGLLPTHLTLQQPCRLRHPPKTGWGRVDGVGDRSARCARAAAAL
jgi:hypothetical protein